MYNQGFTSVELIVVTIVIAILAAIYSGGIIHRGAESS